MTVVACPTLPGSRVEGVCYVRPLSYKNKRLVITFFDHLVLGAAEQLYYRQFIRHSLLHGEGLACETNCYARA